jgi:two-component system phosphate regulon response regulator PhoB
VAYLLIVDDDEDFARAASKVLESDGHEVRVELSTQRALASMAERTPDLAVLDVMFPESSSAGFELARTIRQSKEGWSTVPLLMLTAVNTRFPLGFSRNDIDDDWLPVDAFLEKPVDLDVLRSKVSKLLEQTAAHNHESEA